MAITLKKLSLWEYGVGAPVLTFLFVLLLKVSAPLKYLSHLFPSIFPMAETDGETSWMLLFFNGVFWSLLVFVVGFTLVVLWNKALLSASKGQPELEISRHSLPRIKPLFLTLFSERTILVVGALIIVVMLLFPPFYVEIRLSGRGWTENLGHNFVFAPPPARGRVEGRVDGAILLAQCVGVGIITVLIWLARRGK